MPPPSAIQITKGPEELARAAARFFTEEAVGAVQSGGRFRVALAGGSTPRQLYLHLAGEPLPWNRTELFWSDERHVPPDHPQSNYRMAREALLSRVPLAEENVHRIRAELPEAAQAAEEYEETLREVFALPPPEVPRFDLVLLGIGADGHTASLFPGSNALAESRRLVVAPWVPQLDAFRITLTLPVLNHAATVLFLVSGSEKAEILAKVLDDPSEPPLPARAVRPAAGRLVFLVDEPAARHLPRSVFPTS
jgi:6-phosphogluconolactonase